MLKLNKSDGSSSLKFKSSERGQGTCVAARYEHGIAYLLQACGIACLNLYKLSNLENILVEALHVHLAFILSHYCLSFTFLLHLAIAGVACLVLSDIWNLVDL
jgi:20S proteasome alpha/beta subunit